MAALMTAQLSHAGQWEGYWTDAGDMSDERIGHSVTTLPDGKVLIVGGIHRRFDGEGHFNGFAPNKSVDLYDPVFDKWTRAAPLTTARHSFSSVLLPSGDLFVAGGTSDCCTPLKSAEIYDTEADRWNMTAPSQAAHSSHAAALLHDGRVLIVGGASPTRPEIYDPQADAWTYTQQTTGTWTMTSAFPLYDGRVLVAGGCENASPISEVYDPSIDSWTVVPMNFHHCNGALTKLLDGRVLAVGGGSLDVAMRSELFDPSSQSWVPTSGMLAPRKGPALVTMKDGRAFAIGAGGGAFRWWQSAEAFDPVTQSWEDMPSMFRTRLNPRADVLPDGRVFVAGGSESGWENAEIYDPRIRTAIGTRPFLLSGGAFRARLVESDYIQPLAGRIIRFDIDHQPVCSGVTDIDGWAECRIPVDQAAVGAFLLATNETFSAVFMGDNTYGVTRQPGSLRQLNPLYG